MDPSNVCTWELMQRDFAPPLSPEERVIAVATATDHLMARGYFCRMVRGKGVDVLDPDEIIDDEGIAAAVEKATGLTTHWYPHWPIEAPLKRRRELVDAATLTDEVTATVGEPPAKKKRGPYKKWATLKCAECGKTFKTSDDKHNHYRRGKCVARRG